MKYIMYYERMAALDLVPFEIPSKLFHLRIPLAKPLIMTPFGVLGIMDIASNRTARSLLNGSGGSVKSLASASNRVSK